MSLTQFCEQCLGLCDDSIHLYAGSTCPQALRSSQSKASNSSDPTCERRLGLGEGKGTSPPGAQLQQSLRELTEDTVSLPHAVCSPPFARRLPQLPSEPSLARALGGGGLYLPGLLLLSLEQRKPVLHLPVFLHLLELPPPSKLWLRVPNDVPYHSSSWP